MKNRYKIKYSEQVRINDRSGVMTYWEDRTETVYAENEQRARIEFGILLPRREILSIEQAPVSVA